MSFFKRISVSLKSQLDDAISRIENHDAVIDAALQESRDAIARLKLQHARMQRKIQSIDSQLEQLQADEQDWIRRARSVAKTDEDQALACLERREQCARQGKRLRQQRDQLLDTESSMAGNIDKLEHKLIEDERRLNEFRGRDLTARASQSIQTSSGPDALSLEHAFDRWELTINRSELQADSLDAATTGADHLEAGFKREEAMQARRAELKSLLEDES